MKKLNNKNTRAISILGNFVRLISNGKIETSEDKRVVRPICRFISLMSLTENFSEIIDFPVDDITLIADDLINRLSKKYRTEALSSFDGTVWLIAADNHLKDSSIDYRAVRKAKKRFKEFAPKYFIEGLL